MNKTINTNISGFVFHIVEDTYEILQDYLKKIEANFSLEERSEIMQDIEYRIAELFKQKTSANKEVIVLEDVESVIEIMGSPEEYGDESEYQEEKTETYDTNEQSFSEEEKPEKKLFRDPENEVIGGVCSGLSAYFGLDVVLVRVIFVFMVVLGFSGVILYIILLVIIPEAKTANDRLKMQGKPINIDSLKQTARDLHDTATQKVKDQKIGKKLSRSFDKGVAVSKSFGYYFGKILGIGMIGFGIVSLMFLIAVFIGDGGLIPFWGERQALTVGSALDLVCYSSFQSLILYICLIFLLFIPILGIIVTGIRLVFDIKGFKYYAVTSLVVWFVAAACAGTFGASLGLEFKQSGTSTSSISIENNDQIFIEVADDQYFSNDLNFHQNWDNSNLIVIEQQDIIMGYPQLHIVGTSEDSTFKIEVQKSSRGNNQREATIKANKINYDFVVEGNKITLPPYFKTQVKERFRGQNIEIVIRVPKGKKVHLGEHIERILIPITPENSFENERDEFSNTTWTNKDEEMTFVEG